MLLTTLNEVLVSTGRCPEYPLSNRITAFRRAQRFSSRIRSISGFAGGRIKILVEKTPAFFHHTQGSYFQRQLSANSKEIVDLRIRVVRAAPLSGGERT